MSDASGPRRDSPSVNVIRALLGRLGPLTVAGLALLSAVARAESSAPPAITVLQRSPHAHGGLIFLAPKPAGLAQPGQPSLSQGPLIIDDQGRPVWFLPLTDGSSAADFRVQRYRHEPVLTWSQGKGLGGLPEPGTTDYILDRSYRVLATVRAGNGLNADPHEFQLTARDTALITIYHAVPRDLSALGGPSAGQVIEGVIQEIEIATGRVLLEWHSLDHVGLEESHQALPADPTALWDYFHLNAVSVDEDGNLLVSARHTFAVYKLDRRTGAVLWRLGGARSDFTLGPGVRFSYQHNPIAAGRNTIRIFDNAANGSTVADPSRVIWVHLDLRDKVATLVRALEHPDRLSAPSQGNSQALEEGDTFVGWGQVGRISQLDRHGDLIFDASVPQGEDTYRAYRLPWVGKPATAPIAVGQRNADGTTTVHAVWNGATEVDRWEVLGGPTPDQLRFVARQDWNGLDTATVVTRALAWVQVVARDRYGGVLGRSEPTPTAP
jgi:hypothetical protein